MKRARAADGEDGAAKAAAPTPNPYAKRKVALLLAYNGARYQGLQKNPGATTVAETVEGAMHRAGAISDENLGSLQKISWSNAGRTDKGVHAVGQIISCKIILEPSPMIERVNEQLAGSGIRVLGCERATNSFCAHTSCSSREYEYLIPLYCLRPPPSNDACTRASNGASNGASNCESASTGSSDSVSNGASTASPPKMVPAQREAQGEEEAPDAQRVRPREEVPLTDAERVRLKGLLKRLEGTHYFHNLADFKQTDFQHGDASANSAASHAHLPASAQRYMLSIDVGDEEVLLDGVRWASIHYHGQGFLMHQIRKMTSMVAAIMCGFLPESALDRVLAAPRVPRLPMAPGASLTLRKCWYAKYERNRPEDRGSVHFEEAAEVQRRFLLEEIYPHVAQKEAMGEFHQFIDELKAYDIDRPLVGGTRDTMDNKTRL